MGELLAELVNGDAEPTGDSVRARALDGLGEVGDETLLVSDCLAEDRFG